MSKNVKSNKIAKELIPADTFVIEYVGEIIDVEESRKRLRESGQSGVTNYYILSLDKVRFFFIVKISELINLFYSKVGAFF